jgi:molybdopterin molybdotransferase
MRGSEVEGGFPSLIRLADALKIIFGELRRLPSEQVKLIESLGRVSASEVIAPVDVPPFDRAAVDGYAVRARDTVGASELHPTRLKVVGACEPGREGRVCVRRGQAAEISTGAQLPAGADAVVPVERCRGEDKWVEILEPVPSWKNVSRRGEDLRKGETILRSGKKISPADIGLLAACGYSKVLVVRRPTVSVISTGSELEEPGRPLEDARVFDSNSYSISAAILDSGGVPLPFKPAGEDVRSIRRAIRRGLAQDMVVLIGGSSVGKRDLVPSIVAEEGKLLFHGVAIRPGSPTSFGVVQGKPVFSLPGFPAGCLIAFDLLVRPAIQYMLGCEDARVRVRAKLGRRVPSALGRVDVVRVRIEERDGGWIAHPLRVAGSGILSSVSKADGFILIPEEVERIEEGTEVEVVLYR